jgi:hypothetical protein
MRWKLLNNRANIKEGDILYSKAINKQFRYTSKNIWIDIKKMKTLGNGLYRSATEEDRYPFDPPGFDLFIEISENEGISI